MSKIILEDSTMTNIADAIRSKNGETGQYLPSEMPRKILDIQSGGGGTPRVTAKYAYHKNSPETNLTQGEIDSYVIEANRMFYQCSNLKSIDTINGKKLVVVNPVYMFSGCSGLTSLDVSKFDTSAATTMDSMFSGCSNIKALDVSNFDTQNVTKMTNMFYSCSNIEALDVSNFDTQNVIDMTFMFYNCSKLTDIDISNFDMTKVTSVHNIFASCSRLLKLRIPSIPKCDSNINIFDLSNEKCNDFQFVNNGTFGNNSTSSSSTFSLVYIWRGSADAIATGHDKTNGFFYEAFANSIGENTSGKTRTIKLYTTLYNSLTDEQKALLTDKGYTISYGTS